MSNYITLQNFTEGLDISQTLLHGHQGHDEGKCCNGMQQPTGLCVGIWSCFLPKVVLQGVNKNRQKVLEGLKGIMPLDPPCSTKFQKFGPLGVSVNLLDMILQHCLSGGGPVEECDNLKLFRTQQNMIYTHVFI